MADFLLSAFIDEYSDDLREQISALQRYGIGYVELRHCNGKNVSEFSKSDSAAIKQSFDDAGIEVYSIGSPIGKISIDGKIEEHLRLAEQIFDTANCFNAHNVRIFSFYIPQGKTPEEYRNKVFDALGKLTDLADKHGVTLCHENEALIYGESPENCKKIADYFDGKIKCVFDMGNFVLDGYDPLKAYKLLFDYIEYFHIKDALYAGAIVPAGKGEAKIKEILDDYRVNGAKDTFITLEPHLQTFSGLNALVGKSFDNPYKYKNQEQAFTDAFEKLKEIL